MGAPSILTIHELSVSFGGVRALQRVSVVVERQQICAVIGPNGAGKTTLLNCVSRFHDWDSGTITSDGVDLGHVHARDVVSLGIARTIQNVALFPSMTVLDNVLAGGHSRAIVDPVLSMLAWPSVRASERALRERAAALLEQLGLAAVAHRRAKELSVQTGKRIELARALMSSPKLVLLDEPAAGLNHREVDELAELILDIRRQAGVTILLVEHHMGLVMGISDKVCVLNFGQKIAEGVPAAVQENRQVVLAYLGETEAEAR